jgi:WD40 repeat protein
VILAAFVLLQSWWMVEASKNRSRMVVMQGDLARRNVSQTLALNTALEVLEQRNGLRSVPEAEVLAREALERLREVYAISISHPFPTGEYSPDGTQLVTVSGGRVKLIDAATGQSRDVEWSGSQDALYARWNPAGDSILVGTADGAVFVLSGREPGRPGYFSQAARLGQDPPGWGTFSADGRVIATVRNDGTIRLWNSAAVGQGPMARIPHSGSLGWNAFALSADGTRAAVLVSSSEIQVFDIANGRADAQGTPLRPRPPRPAGAAAARGAEAPRLDPISLFAFDPTNANRVLLAWGGEAAILDIADETLLPIRERETTRGRRIWNAAFNRDGTLIATAHDDGGARVWSGQTGIWQATLREHRSGVVSVRFSPDGQHIATGGQDQTIRIWNLKAPGTNEIPKDARTLVAFARGRLPVRDGNPVVLTDDDRCAVGILASQQCKRSE